MNRTIPDIHAQIRADVDSVLRTDAGKRVFAHLFRLCGYNVSSLTTNRTTGDIATLSTECKEAQRLVYISLRNLAAPDLRAAAEALAEAPLPSASIREEERKTA